MEPLNWWRACSRGQSAEPATSEGPGGVSITETGTGRKISYVITSLDYGGAERQLLALAKGIRQRGWDVDVTTLIAPNAFTEDLSAAGIPLHSLGMKRGVADPRAVVKLARRIRARAPAIVHSHMVHANLLSRVSRIMAPVPLLISTAHSMIEGGRLIEMAYRLTDRLCDLTTNVSPAAVERYVARKLVPRWRIRYVPNGVDLNEFARDSKDGTAIRRSLGVTSEHLWLTVGRLDPVKDHGNLLRAWASVASERAGTLVIVGEGPEKGAVRDLIRELGISERVRMLGARPDVKNLLTAADSFVLSSKFEGLPMVLLEAAATELSIVATDVGGVSEIVQHGETGYLVAPQNHEALATAMRRTMELDPAIRQEFGARGRRRVIERFGLDSVLDTWEALYRTVSESSEPRYWGRPKIEILPDPTTSLA